MDGGGGGLVAHLLGWVGDEKGGFKKKPPARGMLHTKSFPRQ